MNATVILFKVIILLLLQNRIKAIISGYPCHLKTDPPIHTKFMMAITIYPGRTLCGATLLNPSWVLTAAYCVDAPLKYYVMEGVSRDMYGLGKIVWYPPVVKVKKKYLHPNYSTAPLMNNIALLRLRSHLHERDFRGFVVIPSKPYSPEIGDWCTVMGYGQTVGVHPPPFHSPKVLMCTDLQIFNDIDTDTNDTNVVCTDNLTSSICYGDCGGPLIYKGVQIGINSFTSFDNCKGRACYTLIGNYLDFINTTINSRGLQVQCFKLLIILISFIIII